MEKYCVSVDWLQTYCIGNEIKEGRFGDELFQFNVILKDYETAQFKRLYEVWYKKRLVAEIQQCPRTSVINPKATLVKMSNRALYSGIYIALLYAIQRGLNLYYKGITRLDLCYDCNKYAGGRNPERFINAFVSKGAGVKGYIYRRGSDRFACYGSKSRTSSARVTSIRFGSEKSRIGTYIYNKTLELKEVKDKPWIRAMWEENGLVSTDECPVYRAEISIKSQGMDIINMSTAELFRLSPVYLEHADAIEKLFHVYAKKYFDFRICNGQENRRNYDKLYLFELSERITSKPYYMSSCADTGRMEKICYNKLDKLSREYSDLSEQMREGLTTAMNFLKALSGEKLGIIRNNAYKRYLDEFYGKKWVNSTELSYLLAVQEAHEKQRTIEAEDFYTLIVHQYPPIYTEEMKQDIEQNSLIDWLFT